MNSSIDSRSSMELIEIFQINCMTMVCLQEFESSRLRAIKKVVSSTPHICSKKSAKKFGSQTLIHLCNAFSTETNNLSEQCKNFQELLFQALRTLVFWTKGNLQDFKTFRKEKFPKPQKIKEIKIDKKPEVPVQNRNVNEALFISEAQIAAMESKYIRLEMKYRLVKKWETARINQQFMWLSLREKFFFDKIEQHRNAINTEMVFKDEEGVMEAMITNLSIYLEDWMKNYDENMEKLENERQYSITTHKSLVARKQQLEEMFEERQALIYEANKLASAVVIQRWWRSILERQGYYKSRNVAPIKKKKKSKTKRTKKGKK